MGWKRTGTLIDGDFCRWRNLASNDISADRLSRMLMTETVVAEEADRRQKQDGMQTDVACNGQCEGGSGEFSLAGVSEGEESEEGGEGGGRSSQTSEDGVGG